MRNQEQNKKLRYASLIRRHIIFFLETPLVAGDQATKKEY